jgi:MFS family permease
LSRGESHSGDDAPELEVVLSQAPDGRELPSRGYSRYVLGVCFALTALNVMDRQVLSVLVEPVKAEFGLSDSEMGLLTGTAFALSHALAMLPVARWADLGNRRDIIAGGIFIWSALTSLTGAAVAYWQIFVTRIGVGACETVGTGPAQSLLSDYFPPERRAGALSIHGAGGTVGAMAGFAIGGVLADTVGWRWTFVYFGAPGLLLAILMWMTVREPPRGAIEGLDADEAPGIWETLRFLGGLRTFRQVVLAGSLNSIVSWSLLSWAAAAMQRAHGLDLAEVGPRLALSMTLPTAVGMIVAGFVCDRLGRGDPRSYLWVPAAASVVAVPFSLAFLLSGNADMAFLWIVPGAFCNGMWVGTYNAVVQSLAKPRMRASAGAIHVLVGSGLIGQGSGPLIAGILSDVLEPRYGIDSLRFALAAIVFCHIWGAVHSVVAARTYKQDMLAKTR